MWHDMYDVNDRSIVEEAALLHSWDWYTMRCSTSLATFLFKQYAGYAHVVHTNKFQKYKTDCCSQDLDKQGQITAIHIKNVQSDTHGVCLSTCNAEAYQLIAQ